MMVVRFLEGMGDLQQRRFSEASPSHAIGCGVLLAVAFIESVGNRHAGVAGEIADAKLDATATD